MIALVFSVLVATVQPDWCLIDRCNWDLIGQPKAAVTQPEALPSDNKPRQCQGNQCDARPIAGQTCPNCQSCPTRPRQQQPAYQYQTWGIFRRR